MDKKQKKHKRTNNLPFHLYKVLRKSKLIRIKILLAVTGDWMGGTLIIQKREH